MEFLQKFGNKVRRLRKEKGYTQDELAKLLKYTSRSTVNKIEKGLIDPPQSKILELANIFDCSPLYFLDVEPNMETGYSSVTITTQNTGVHSFYLDQEDTQKLLNFLNELNLEVKE